MKNNNNEFNPSCTRQILIGLLIIIGFCPPNIAQEESAPLPGSPTSISLPMPEQNNPQPSTIPQVSAPIIDVGASEKTDIISSISSEDFPVSINGLKTLVGKYKEAAKEAPLGEASLNPFLVWLDGLIKSHSKLAAAFSKQNNLKTDFDSECSLMRELHQIKDEVLYLKAQTLIKEKRLKQAIPILIEIICTEPNSPLGQTAYQHLKSSGFSFQFRTESHEEPLSSKSNKLSKPNKANKSPKKNSSAPLLNGKNQ